MAKRLKNLKPKKTYFRPDDNKYKCNWCLSYHYEYNGIDIDYNECLKKEITCFDIEKHRFCKHFEDFVNRKTVPPYYHEIDLPF